MQIPEAFYTRMQSLLGSEAPAFFAALQQPPFRALRRNPLKYTQSQLEAGLPFPLRAAPFSPLSFYVPDEFQAGRCPLHHAGVFYMQEPSAAAAVTVLDPQPGERVLDLCAAPGGKSTQIAGALSGQGLLWSNEVVRSRVPALLSNLERWGTRNAVISSCRPEILCQALEGFFDRVLVDAPCSGEGMFRRSEQAVSDWSPAHVSACAVRQNAILDSAAQALRPGGVLVYSTCTFSQEENEGVIESFLKTHPAFSLEPCGLSAGHPAFDGLARRIYPMDGGEGHFVARMRREGEAERLPAAPAPAPSAAAQAMLESLYRETLAGTPAQIGEKLYLLPPDLPSLHGLGVVRAGLLLGEEKPARGGRKKGDSRFVPAHAAFMAVKPDMLQACLSLSAEDPRVLAFLYGEELEAPETLHGFCGISVEGAVLGFGKCSGGRFKNHYPKGLRML